VASRVASPLDLRSSKNNLDIARHGDPPRESPDAEASAFSHPARPTEFRASAIAPPGRLIARFALLCPLPFRRSFSVLGLGSPPRVATTYATTRSGEYPIPITTAIGMARGYRRPSRTIVFPPPPSSAESRRSRERENYLSYVARGQNPWALYSRRVSVR